MGMCVSMSVSTCFDYVVQSALFGPAIYVSARAVVALSVVNVGGEVLAQRLVWLCVGCVESVECGHPGMFEDDPQWQTQEKSVFQWCVHALIATAHDAAPSIHHLS